MRKQGQVDRGGADMIRLLPTNCCQIRVVRNGREIFATEADLAEAAQLAEAAIETPGVVAYVSTAFVERIYWSEKQ